MEEQKKISTFAVVSVVVLVLVIAGFGAFIYMKQPATAETQIKNPVSPNPVPILSPTPTPARTTTSSIYKDGTYSAVGNYNSPAGTESINITLTLKDDVITDAQFVSNATFPQSKQFQAIFGANYKTLVVGKKIQDVNLTKVSGSSLTPKGFNDAVAKIKVSAQA